MARNKCANIGAHLYDGEFQINFDCVGVAACRYALCPVMPPDGSEECTFQQYGACRNPFAQCAAIEALKKRLAKELKARSEDA